MKSLLKPVAAACMIAVALSGPLGPTLVHATVHALEDAHEYSHEGTTHSHDHDGDSEHHEFLQAVVTPATITNSPTLDPVQTGRGRLASAFGASSPDACAPALDEPFDTGPPQKVVALLLATTPSDRAPPA